MNRSLVKLLIICLLTVSCNLDTFNRYGDSIQEYLQDPKTRYIKNSDNDVNNLSQCPFLIELGDWNYYDSKWGGIWDRRNVWKDGSINSYKRFGLNFAQDNLISNKLNAKPNTHPIYIGPWQDTVLTKPTPFTLSLTNLFRSDEQKDRKLRALDYRRTLKIRFFAYQELDSGEIRYSYESMNNKNKKIKSKPFSLSKKTKIAPNRFDLCVVKWTAKFGYNAIAEVKSKNSFSKDYLVPTGRIIEVK